MLNFLSAKATLFVALLSFSWFLSTAQNDVISLTASNASGNQDQTVVYFTPGATSAFDGSFDALKMFSSNPAVPGLFTVSSDSIALSINGLPPFTSGTTVPVYFTSSQNINYTLNADLTQCNVNWDVVLLDSITLNTQDLRTGGYSFSHITTNTEKRFFLQINCDVDWIQGNSVCLNNGLVTLANASIPGGTYSGPGVISSSGVFDPVAAGPGTHILTYSVANGNCLATDTSTIEVVPVPELNLPADTFTTTGNALLLNYNITGGSGNYSINWNSPVASSSLNSLTTIPLSQDTTLIATIQDQSTGCLVYDTVHVFVFPELMVNVLINPTEICAGDSSNVQFAISGGTGSNAIQLTPLPDAINGNQYLLSPNQNTTYTYIVNDGFQTKTGSFDITVNPIPAISISAPAAICDNINTVQFSAQPSGGMFSGTGISPQGLLDVSSLAPGFYTYNYSYTSSAGCSSADSVEIEVLQAPSVNVSSTITIPNGAFTTLNVLNPQPGLVYNWAPANFLSSTTGSSVTTNSLSNSQKFYVTATNPANGCSTTDSIQVSVTGTPLAIDITSSAFTICQGDTTTVNAVITGGTGSYTISWSPTSILNAPTAVSTLAYPTQTQKVFVQANDGFNTVIDSAIIQVYPAVNVTWSGQFDRCINTGSIVLSGGTPSGGVYSGPGVQNGVFNPLQAGVGTHSLIYTYTTSNGCEYSASKSVEVFPAPQAVLPSLGTICVSAVPFTLTMGIPQGGIYSGAGVVNGVSFDPSVAGTGQHIITYTFTTNEGCTTSSSALINVVPPPAVSLSPFDVVCSPSEPVFALTGGVPSGGSYSGTGVQNGNFNPAIGPGDYIISYTVDAGTGCTSTTSRVLTVLPQLAVNAPADFNIPFGTNTALPTAVVNGSGFYAYSWQPADSLINPSSANPTTINLSSTNTFSVQITDLQTGCTASDSVRVNVLGSPLSVDSIANFSICSGDSLDLTGVASGGSGNYSYYWTPSTDILNPLDSQVTIVPTADRTITLTVGDGFNFVNTTFQITLNHPVAVQAGSYGPVCVNASNVQLQGTPSGGTFSGTGVSGNTFDPALAGVGSHWIQYELVNGGCISRDSVLIEVTPEVYLSVNIPDTICVNQSLTLPSAGIFSGPFIANNQFTPSSTGSFVITHVLLSNGCSDTSSYTIEVIESPVIQFPVVSPLCANQMPISLASTIPTGGTFSGTGISGSSFDPSVGPGVYSILYSYNNGYCTTTDTLEITVNDIPTANWSAPSQVCESAQPIVLSIPINGVLSGSAIVGNTFDPSQAVLGWNTIQLTLSNGSCSATYTDSIFVFGGNAITAQLPDSVCLSSSPIQLTAYPSGGNWSGTGVSGGYFAPPVPGDYLLTYALNSTSGCRDTMTHSIHVLPNATINSGIPSILCVSDAPVSLNTNNGDGFWTGIGVAGNVFDPLTSGAGTFVLTFHPTNGQCYANSTDTVQVFENPSVDLGPDFFVQQLQAASLNTTVSGGSGSYQYQWAPNSLIQTNNGSNIVTNGLVQSTNFSVTVTDVISGCTATDQVAVTINSAPLTATVSISNSTICSGETATINVLPQGGTGNYTITYSPTTGLSGTGSPVFANPTTSQTYTVTISDGVQSINSTVVLNVVPVPQATFTLVDSVCVDDSPIQLTGGSPNGGVYSGNGVINGVFYPDVAGAGNHTLTYIVSNSLGCSDTAQSAIHVLTLPSTPVITRNGAILSTASGFSSYAWFWNGLLLPNSNNSSIPISQSGQYTVEVTDGNGCTALSAPFDVLFVGVTELENEELIVFPNPSSSFIDVTITTLMVEAVISDLMGRIVLVQNTNGRNSVKLDISQLASGTYILSVKTNSGWTHRRITVSQ